MGDILTAVMRWIHIASVIMLLGGIIFWRFVMDPSTKRITPEDYKELEEGAAAHFRPLVYIVMVTLVISGFYNFLIKPGHSTLYQALFGIKILLALHVFSVAILATAPNNQRRGRQLLGGAISGLIIVLIAAYLKGIA
ncbi:MAG TPA: hypothetical protein VMJ75_28460 [Candidatus Acidoferrales bacterium]|nr:hypothetical protein [Candidatus Acidoferrales bacterium]